MIPKAIAVSFKENVTLEVTFSTGEIKVYTMSGLFNELPQLSALADETLFRSGRLLGGDGIIWNDELDIAAEEIYQNGILVSTMDPPIEIKMGNCIAELRNKQHLSQSELAKRIGIDQSDLSKIERGVANPSLKMLKRIADALGKKLDILFK